MPEIHIRKEGMVGRVTLSRPEALNALTWAMCLEIARALDDWAEDPQVALVILDAEGTKAFCAGGDIAEMYRSGIEGDYDYGRSFWRDEYRMNARLAEYPKPIVSFLHGFVMGGGVGLGGHCSHRIVGESARIAMPECSIGFVPDVGGTYRLAQAPGRLGEYLGLTAARMEPGDALYAGFADHFVPEAEWPALKDALIASGDAGAVAEAARAAPHGKLVDWQTQIDLFFGGKELADIVRALRADGSDFARETRAALERNAPLSMAVTLKMIRRLRGPSLTIRDALELEYRVSYRIMEHGDFLEGIRAAIIDKDRQPKWRHASMEVPEADVDHMLAPLARDALTFRA
ncbi:Enoyl-CoA hydratase/carnithine racemase [Palleronia marisminoris]|uniref:3-hydroxyisobutyryl-CoA hydrolase n=1 Tax=Palleronia marisminoris TaxID=315423 RepID=A0A1Y5RBL1_9RHOB|nr:enoyl-CoA hydratase/isomerase family protein [Palleronia marisminoris]SFG10444.1 Enoyl-CoA hydratase/carnithine racemase [Palleronia marisminoris]SLN13288.1 putative enoyl-CoA hydratase echA8 [Palleronia marisminoris]